MCSFSLRCSALHWFTRSTIPALTIFLFFAAGLPLASSGTPQKTFGGASQSTPDPIIPCTTSGFSVDATLNYVLTAANLTRFHRIERSTTSARIGYVVTTDSVTNERWLITYDGRSMQTIRRTIIQLPGNLDYNGTQIAGEVSGGVLYLFRLVNTGRLTCAAPGANPCVSLAKYDIYGNLLGESIQGSIAAPNIDDARLNGASTILLSYNAGASRGLMSWSIPGGSFIADSTGLGIAASGQLALNGDAGSQYVGYSDAAKTVKRISLDSVTVSNTGNFGFTGLNLIGAVVSIPAFSLVGYSTSVGGIKADENYRNLTSLADIGNLFPWILADGSAAPGSTFYDSVNGQLYSWRTTIGRIARLAPFGGTILERLDCGTPCTVTTAPTTDFILSNARLYNAADISPGVGAITRIKVCATGGPPA